jgi:REP element-mobilizing transposase RayT
MPLFTTPEEHELYLGLYERHALPRGWVTLAWCLIWNHYHFVVQLTDDKLSDGMRAINHGFSRRINAIHERTGKGHAVRHCFYAGEIKSDAQLAVTCRYVDLNPVAAQLCDRPEDWPWSGYAATLGIHPPRRFHNTLDLLDRFGPDPDKARIAYRGFVTRDEPFPGKGYESVTFPVGDVVRSQP